MNRADADQQRGAAAHPRRLRAGAEREVVDVDPPRVGLQHEREVQAGAALLEDRGAVRQ